MRTTAFRSATEGEQTVWLGLYPGPSGSLVFTLRFWGLANIRLFQCLWCNTNKACLDYPVTRILPPSSLCTLSSARWGVCWGKSSCSWNSCGVSTAWGSLGVLS